ncbi:MAG TPA: NAD(P)H-hydrate dehydratase [Myxococcales bacterium]|nr:NAD(P)H-hydrate dehydratase [Myxococcales bacterium]
MKRALTSDQMRNLEQAAGAQFGMSEALLMENAGGALAEAALRLASPSGRFLVLCGRGNNGGDGLVAARKLAGIGRAVHLDMVAGTEGLKGEVDRNLQALGVSGVSASALPPDFPAGPGDVVIDALFGTGLNRAPEGGYAEAIGRIARWRARGARVLSADLPSGLNADTGRAFDPCVQADATVAFGHLKVGQVLEPGAHLSGEVAVADIALPAPEVAGLGGPAVALVEEADARGRVPPRRPDAHKGSFGHVLVVAGSRGKTGAAALCATAALRAGSGLVTVATRPDALFSVMSATPELMGQELSGDGPLGPNDAMAILQAAEGKQAVVLGPGIPRGEHTGHLLRTLLAELAIPMVIDADGLNALAGNLDALSSAQAPALLTPHPGEMSRLAGRATSEVQADRINAARALAQAHNAVVVLKGARSVIALENGSCFVNPTGNPGMATGGTGDVLAGVCGGLLSQGLSREDAAMIGAYVHGLAGDRVSRRTGRMGLIASDLLGGLQEVWVEWDR